VPERNVRIAGSGTIEGGSYGQVKIAGSGKVTGDLEAEEFSSAGSATAQGNLKARRFECAGSFRCQGDLELEEGEAAGSFRVGGKLRAKEMKIAGSTHGQSISGGYLRISGSLETQGNVEVETLRLSGSFRIGGLLSADKAEIEMYGICEAQEIGGGKIEVRAGSKSLGGLVGEVLEALFGTSRMRKLRAKVIEGDEIKLEYTQAEVVRGGKVKIGPGCHVKRVEYTESLERDPQSKVEEEVRE